MVMGTEIPHFREDGLFLGMSDVAFLMPDGSLLAVEVKKIKVHRRSKRRCPPRKKVGCQARKYHALWQGMYPDMVVVGAIFTNDRGLEIIE